MLAVLQVDVRADGCRVLGATDGPEIPLNRVTIGGPFKVVDGGRVSYVRTTS